MPDFVDTIYRYDGSYEGFLSAVFESHTRREVPAGYLSGESDFLPLAPVREIATDPDRADRVTRGLAKKAGSRAEMLARLAFLTILPDKEIAIDRFIRFALKTGPKIATMYAHEWVHPLEKAVHHLQEEAHLLTGFLRFSDYDGVLAAVIDPKNQVLPLLAPHFTDRFPREVFMIFDRTHNQLLASVRGKYTITDATGFALPTPGESERKTRALWRRFFETIAIHGRENPICQRTHLPLRYRGTMTEFFAESPTRTGGQLPGHLL